MNSHDDIKQWRHDSKDWAAESSRWIAEQARAKSTLLELEGFLGAHGDQLVGFGTSIGALEATLVDDHHHDAARNAHHAAKGLHLALKSAHHEMMARVNALREVSFK